MSESASPVKQLKDLTPSAAAEIPKYRADIAEMEGEIQKLRQGAVSEDDFRKYRLQRGVYGQKQKPDIQMMRVKIPWGRLTADQLVALADISDEYAGEDRKGVSHVTTRQDIQYHFVKLDRTVECMKRLADAGLTTREACANTVRNVTADPLAGAAGRVLTCRLCGSCGLFLHAAKRPSEHAAQVQDCIFRQHCGPRTHSHARPRMSGADGERQRSRSARVQDACRRRTGN